MIQTRAFFFWCFNSSIVLDSYVRICSFFGSKNRPAAMKIVHSVRQSPTMMEETTHGCERLGMGLVQGRFEGTAFFPIPTKIRSRLSRYCSAIRSCNASLLEIEGVKPLWRWFYPYLFAFVAWNGRVTAYRISVEFHPCLIGNSRDPFLVLDMVTRAMLCPDP